MLSYLRQHTFTHPPLPVHQLTHTHTHTQHDLMHQLTKQKTLTLFLPLQDIPPQIWLALTETLSLLVRTPFPVSSSFKGGVNKVNKYLLADSEPFYKPLLTRKSRLPQKKKRRKSSTSFAYCMIERCDWTCHVLHNSGWLNKQSCDWSWDHVTR